MTLTDEEIALGLNDIESNQPRITAHNGLITINGATEGSVVSVHTASGATAGKAVVSNGTGFVITLPLFTQLQAKDHRQFLSRIYFLRGCVA